MTYSSFALISVFLKGNIDIQKQCSHTGKTERNIFEAVVGGIA